MKKVLKYIGIFLLIFTLFFGYKVYSNYNTSQKIIAVQESSLSKYYSLFFLQHNRTPYNLNEFKKYLSTRDKKLIELINSADIKYIRDKNGVASFYHYGFDNKNDSLKVKYNQIENLLEVFYKKGDIEIENYYNFRPKTNAIYRVEKDTIYLVQKINIHKIYSRELKCDSLITNFEEDIKHCMLSCRIENGVIKHSDTIPEGVNSYHSITDSFSDKTKQLFLNQLNKINKSLDKNSVYFATFYNVDIKDYKCK